MSAGVFYGFLSRTDTDVKFANIAGRQCLLLDQLRDYAHRVHHGEEELIAVLRQLDPEVRVVVMSGYTQKKEEHVKNLKIAGWLDKPVEVNNLTKVLREALHGSR